MSQHGPLFLILLLVYIFSPALFSWVTNSHGVWYKPFIVWLLIIAAAFAWQRRSNSK